ncbi:hypothetical protein CMUS01_11111, partial [Colletotrichum musicola]
MTLPLARLTIRQVPCGQGTERGPRRRDAHLFRPQAPDHAGHRRRHDWL